MECPECTFENPAGMNFCGKCGHKLEKVCPSCSFGNPPEFEFCGGCGQRLLQSEAPPPKDLSFDEKLAKIQKYLPSGLTEKVLSQRDKIEGEKRQVTIMFVDMKGFTPLTEKLGPEETFSLMDQVFELMIHKVHDYEGTVNELRGDGMLAFFGAPIALEDAPQRAIRSALSIHREMTRFNEKLKDEKKIPPLLVRIGINSGPVVVGTVGNDLRVQFTAVGDTINMAARMEQLAEPGTTYVTEDTFNLTEGFFRFQALGEKEIKGKERPMRVYQVIAPSTRRTRFDVSAERGLTRFVGRERELEIMLDAFARAKEGRGQAVSIVGEAGVGKSRLLYEFRKAVANEDIVFMEGKCLSYGRGTAYHPYIDVLKANFGLEDGDADADVARKVNRGLTTLGVDETATLPYFLELLSVKDSGIDKISMSPEARKDRIHEALQRITLKGSERRPLVFAFEDLHWMDKSSQEATKMLLQSIPGARVLMIFTYRPEFLHTWGGKSFHSHVTLNRLSNRECLAMVAGLLGSDNMAPDLPDLILEKTEGVPFFIEEFVRSLRDMGIIERTNDMYHLSKDVDRVTIPSTIQDVLMARVDSLPDAAKEVLQAGSVIEREFSYELIEAVTGLPEQELRSLLSTLKDAELLYERGIFPRSVFIFKHALTRDVVYDSILSGRKKKLHEEIANTIEERYRENIEEHYRVLAEHYVIADNWEKGAHYAKLAGKKAAMTGALTDVVDCAKKALSCLERSPRTDQVLRKIIALRCVLATHLIEMNYFVEARKTTDPIVEQAIEKGDKKRISQIFTVAGGTECCVEENFPVAFEHLEKGLKTSEELGDLGAMQVANSGFWLAYALSLDCQFERAVRCLEKSTDIIFSAEMLWRKSSMRSLISFQCYYFQGRLDLALQTSLAALQMAEESGDIYSTTFAHTACGISYYGKGVLNASKGHLLNGLNHSKRMDLFYCGAMTSHFLGELFSDIGEYQSAAHHYENAIISWQSIQWLPSWVNFNRIGVVRSKLMRNESDADLQSLRSLVRENKIRQLEGWIRRYLGEILLNIGDQHFSEAQHWIEEAIEADERNGMRFHLGRDYAVYAELFKRKGDRVGAKEQLGKAIEIYRECGADGWVTKAEEELARMS